MKETMELIKKDTERMKKELAHAQLLRERRAHRTTQSSSAAANGNGRKPIHHHHHHKGKNKNKVSHHQPMLKARSVSLANKEKKNYDTHKHKVINKKCFCGICFDIKPASDMFTGCKCHHPFCTHCICSHVAAKIQQNVLKVNCPNPKCNMELKPEYLQPILPNEVMVRWESAKYESSIASWQRTYCPFKNCSVLLVNDGNRGHDMTRTSSECPSCHRLFCMQCKVPWHAGMNCKEFQKSKRNQGETDLDRKFLELAKSKMWQRCPKCSIYVQRCSGCEHMTCRCGCNFCYKCGKNWMFGHMAEQWESRLANLQEVLAIIHHKGGNSGS